jgi:hypothetical protein
MSLFDRLIARLSHIPQPSRAVTRTTHRSPTQPPATGFVRALDQPLLHLTPRDGWTLRHACAGTHIFGANGSGKTTGSGRALAHAFLASGFGGLVLCAKPDEARTWLRYAVDTGRVDDVLIVAADGDWRFNFLDYELRRPADNPAARVENLLSTLLNVLEQSGRDSSGEESQFWKQAAELLLRNALLVLAAAEPRFTLLDLQRFLDSAPRSRDELRDPAFSGSTCRTLLDSARAAYRAEGREPDYQVIENYWLSQYPSLPERTRGSVIFTLGTMLQDVQTGTMRELFCTTTNVLPDDTHEGAIIILDLPAVASRTNRLAQTLFKTVWQQATLRRRVGPQTRPVFLWADEAHFFITPYDTDFQSLARDRLACTVYMTQNLSAYHQRLPARNAQAMTSAFLGYFQTQIFHALSDPATIQHAAYLFGKRDRTYINASTSHQTGTSTSWGSSHGSSASGAPNGSNWNVTSGHNHGHGESQSRSTGWSAQHAVEDTLRPEDFTALKTGGPDNGNTVAAFCFRTGTTWSHGTTCLYAEFDQR